MLYLYFLRDIKGAMYKNMQPKPMVIYGYSWSNGKMGSYEVNFQVCGGGGGCGPQEWQGVYYFWQSLDGVASLTKGGS